MTGRRKGRKPGKLEQKNKMEKDEKGTGEKEILKRGREKGEGGK